MLPYKTEAGPRRQLKQQDKLRPPASAEQSDCDNSFIIAAHTFDYRQLCPDSALQWVGMTGGNTGLIISRKLADMTT